MGRSWRMFHRIFPQHDVYDVYVNVVGMSEEYFDTIGMCTGKIRRTCIGSYRNIRLGMFTENTRGKLGMTIGNVILFIW